MERKNLVLAFLASIIALWLLGLGPLISVPIIGLIGCLGVIAEVTEPDNALKRYIYCYSKGFLTFTVAVLLTVLVSLIFAVPLTKVVVEVLTGTVLTKLSTTGIEQYRIMSLVIIIFSSFLAYMIVYGGLTGKKWRVIVAMILLIVFLSSFWQLRLKDLPLGQRLIKQIAVTLAKGSRQIGTINQEVTKVYVATYDATTETFITIEPQDQIVKVDSPVKVKLASPIIVYAEQAFINVLLVNSDGEFSLDPNDPGVWLPVEMVTMGRKKFSQLVTPTINSPMSESNKNFSIVNQQDILDAVPLESVVHLKAPTVELEKNSNTVTVTSNDWVSTGIAPYEDVLIEIGRFGVSEDVNRLEARIDGGQIPILTPRKVDNEKWRAVVNFNSGGQNKDRHQIELRLKYGLPLVVTVQKLGK